MNKHKTGYYYIIENPHDVKQDEQYFQKDLQSLHDTPNIHFDLPQRLEKPIWEDIADQYTTLFAPKYNFYNYENYKKKEYTEPLTRQKQQTILQQAELEMQEQQKSQSKEQGQQKLNLLKRFQKDLKDHKEQNTDQQEQNNNNHHSQQNNHNKVSFLGLCDTLTTNISSKKKLLLHTFTDHFQSNKFDDYKQQINNIKQHNQELQEQEQQDHKKIKLSTKVRFNGLEHEQQKKNLEKLLNDDNTQIVDLENKIVPNTFSLNKQLVIINRDEKGGYAPRINYELKNQVFKQEEYVRPNRRRLNHSWHEETYNKEMFDRNYKDYNKDVVVQGKFMQYYEQIQHGNTQQNIQQSQTNHDNQLQKQGSIHPKRSIYKNHGFNHNQLINQAKIQQTDHSVNHQSIMVNQSTNATTIQKESNPPTQQSNIPFSYHGHTHQKQHQEKDKKKPPKNKIFTKINYRRRSCMCPKCGGESTKLYKYSDLILEKEILPHQLQLILKMAQKFEEEQQKQQQEEEIKQQAPSPQKKQKRRRSSLLHEYFNNNLVNNKNIIQTIEEENAIKNSSASPNQTNYIMSKKPSHSEIRTQKYSVLDQFSENNSIKEGVEKVDTMNSKSSTIFQTKEENEISQGMLRVSQLQFHKQDPKQQQKSTIINPFKKKILEQDKKLKEFMQRVPYSSYKDYQKRLSLQIHDPNNINNTQNYQRPQSNIRKIQSSQGPRNYIQKQRITTPSTTKHNTKNKDLEDKSPNNNNNNNKSLTNMKTIEYQLEQLEQHQQQQQQQQNPRKSKKSKKAKTQNLYQAIKQFSENCPKIVYLKMQVNEKKKKKGHFEIKSNNEIFIKPTKSPKNNKKFHSTQNSNFFSQNRQNSSQSQLRNRSSQFSSTYLSNYNNFIQGQDLNKKDFKESISGRSTAPSHCKSRSQDLRPHTRSYQSSKFNSRQGTPFSSSNYDGFQFYNQGRDFIKKNTQYNTTTNSNFYQCQNQNSNNNNNNDYQATKQSYKKMRKKFKTNQSNCSQGFNPRVSTAPLNQKRNIVQNRQK